jgi:CHAT domain-containing protein
MSALGAVPPERIWWCPTGALGLLPLHAAGYHTVDDARTVLARSVSSYTPSLSALIAARARARPATADLTATTGAGRPLVVALPSTPGYAALPHVREEAAGLPFEHDTLTGPEATVAAVAARLPSCPLAHFACHGRQRATDPMGNGIVLHDGVLTPWTLAGLEVRHGELAYLSACDTALGDADVTDEAVHPAAVLHITGFRHVIAALGPVRDQHSVVAAHEVYAALRDGTEPARAVHHAVSSLRRQYPAMPTIWANYIHLGP